MVIVIVLVVVLILVPLALWGLSRMRAGRPEGQGKPESRAAGRMVGASFLVVTAALGIALPLIVLTGNHSHASAKVGNVRLTAGEKNGRELFGQHCGVCHTLSAAAAIGKVGPNLDVLRPPASLVLHTIDNGCLPNASGATVSEVCLGQGVMPADVVTGQDAQDVASFVAAVTGHPPSRPPAAANTTATATTPAPTPTTSTSSTPAPSGATQVLALAANPSGELKYDKSTLSAKAGKVEIKFTNDSPVPHDVTVQSGTSGPSLGATPIFSHGTKTLTLTLKPGKYTYYCSVPGHRQAGMLGTLTVSAGGGAAPASSSTTAAAGGAPSAPSGATQVLALAANPSGELKYDKSTLSAKAGKVEIKFTNDSPVPHDVTVQSGTSGPSLGATPIFSHGTKTLTLTLKPGKYTYYCSVPGHRQAGMLGTLTVSAGGGAAPTTSTSSTPAPSGATQVLALAANPSGQLKYDKSTLSAKAGKVEIKFTNDSPVPHDVTVQSGTSGPSLGATPIFSHGTKTLTLTLKPGKYTYYCSVPGHRQAGMLGTLTVS